MPQRIACISLDFELDYGSRIGQFNILQEQREEIGRLGDLFISLNVPVSSFVVTQVLQDYPEAMAALKHISQDFHCHSHTHNTLDFDNRNENLVKYV